MDQLKEKAVFVGIIKKSILMNFSFLRRLPV